MEFVRKIVDASSLMKIVQLPDALKNRKLEIIVLPIDDEEIQRKGKNVPGLSDITQSLVGSIPLPDASLEQIKRERLEKYESNV